MICKICNLKETNSTMGVCWECIAFSWIYMSEEGISYAVIEED